MTEEDNDQPASVPTQLIVGTLQKVLEDWEEFKKLPVYDMILQGWWPSIRRKRGVQYITLRKQIKDPETKAWRVQEKSLGRYVTERWQALDTLVPHKIPEQAEGAEENDGSLSPQEEGSQQMPAGGVPTKTEIEAYVGSKPRPSSVLSTKVGKPRVLESTIHPDLQTLQWYYWVQQTCGYAGSFEQFINESVDTLFREHYKLELAIIVQKD